MKSKLIFLYTLLLTLIFTGCQSDVAVSYIGDSGRKSYEDSFVFNGSLSAETVNVLGNHLLQKKMEDSPEIFIRELERLYETEPAENILTAIAETSQMIAASMRKSPDIAARYDLTTLLYTSLYITEVTEKNSPRLFAPEAVG